MSTHNGYNLRTARSNIVVCNTYIARCVSISQTCYIESFHALSIDFSRVPVRTTCSDSTLSPECLIGITCTPASSAEVVSSILVSRICVFFSVAESVRTLLVSKIQSLVDELLEC